MPDPTIRNIQKHARLSEDGRYRYTLERSWDNGTGRELHSLVWVALNPSTADAHRDDPTVRKLVQFSAQWGYQRLVLVNLFAYRSPKPEVLFGVDDPVGPENDRWIDWALQETRYAVVSWGAKGAVFPERVKQVLGLIYARQARPFCLGTTMGGDPVHPLYIPFATTLRPWEPNVEIERPVLGPDVPTALGVG